MPLLFKSVLLHQKVERKYIERKEWWNGGIVE